jgi:hypothetical protein
VQFFKQSTPRSGAASDLAMAKDCARHARMFFDRPAFDLLSAVEGRFAVAPAPGMIDALRRDYGNMSGMIFGPVPPFDAVLESIVSLDARLNDRR